MYYITSDNSIMEIEDFMLYVEFLKSFVEDFIFSTWFDEEDFLGTQTYSYLLMKYEP